jgi:D-xylose transport system substrate-binding protein
MRWDARSPNQAARGHCDVRVLVVSSWHIGRQLTFITLFKVPEYQISRPVTGFILPRQKTFRNRLLWCKIRVFLINFSYYFRGLTRLPFGSLIKPINMKCMKIFLVCALFVLTSVTWAQKVGLLMDSYVIERWRTDQSLFIERVKALGGKVVVEVPHGNADEQVRLGKKLIADGVDVLVIVPTDGQKAIAIVEAAKAAKIPVLSYDRLIPTKDVDLYISYDGTKVGKMQAQYAKDRMPSGNYMLLNGPKSDNNSIMFRNGQMSVLDADIKSGKIKIIADFILDDWSELEAIMKVEEFLSSNNIQPDAIIAANDALATGALQVLPREMIGKVIITGQDAERAALRNIVAGNQSMTVYKPIKPLAYQAAELAIKLAKNETIKSSQMKNGNYEVNAILLEPIVVDKGNYKDTIIKDGHLSMSEINN